MLPILSYTLLQQNGVRTHPESVGFSACFFFFFFGVCAAKKGEIFGACCARVKRLSWISQNIS